ncbi:MAG: hypothetical protein IID39_00255 [Planctomycetes bacterium]|nr:hypothetical protein [Planctomycetota bacterium]
MRVLRNSISLVILAGWVLLPGCAGTDPEQAHLRLKPVRPFEPDIPIPRGFVIVDQASEDRSTGSARLYLRHVYEGKADKHAIREFYRREMPLAQWVKVSDGNIKGDLTMRFEKGGESCTVHVTDRRKGLVFKTARIEVIVAREERGQMPPITRDES